jgi:hypothetical protein
MSGNSQVRYTHPGIPHELSITVDFFIMHTVGSLPNPMHYENYALWDIHLSEKWKFFLVQRLCVMRIMHYKVMHYEKINCISLCSLLLRWPIWHLFWPYLMTSLSTKCISLPSWTYNVLITYLNVSIHVYCRYFFFKNLHQFLKAGDR